MKFELFQSEKDGKYYFRLKAANGKIVLSSQGYASKQACEKGIRSVKRNSKDKTRYESKSSKNGKYHFHIKALNGQIIGQSQIYTNTKSCEAGIASITKGAEEALVKILH